MPKHRRHHHHVTFARDTTNPNPRGQTLDIERLDLFVHAYTRGEKMLAYHEPNRQTDSTTNHTNPHVDLPQSSILPPVWDAIPSELTASARWILWQARPKPNSEKLDKVPIDPRTGHKANAHDKSIWLTFDQVRLYFEQTTKADGIGFVLGDGFCGVDIDDCIDDDGRIDDHSRNAINRLGSYTEISPSGRGVKIFLKGKKKGKRCQVGNIEIYDGGRFFTVTGRHLDGTPEAVLSRQPELESLYHDLFGRSEAKSDDRTGSRGGDGVSLDAVEIINRLRQSVKAAKFEKLYQGDISDYPSESEADCALLALLLWSSRHDVAPAVSIFEASPYFAQKDDNHKRKWERDDYQERTIAKALDGLGKYDPNYRSGSNSSQKSASSGNGKPSGNGKRPSSERDKEATTAKPTPEITFTEGWLSRLFVSQHGQDLRYCPAWKSWLEWDGKRWKETSTENVRSLANKTVRSLYAEAAKMEDSPDRKERATFAFRSDNERRCKAIVEMASWEITITPDQFDRDPYLLNTPSGTVDLRTGDLREHRREDFITKMTAAPYEKTAKFPLFDDFLEQFLPDKEVQGFVQRAMGYSSTGLATEEVLFFPFGPTATGKSTLLRAVQEVLGDYAATADFDTLLAQATDRNGRPKTELARLHGKRFVVSVEVDHGVKLAEGLVKWITGQDKVVARFLYGKEFEFLPSFTLWLAANHRPRANDEDDALWRRIHQIPFDQQIPKAERDRTVKERLCDPSYAGAAILAWVVEGCLEWQRRGLDVPEAVERTTAEYRQEMNPIGDFIDECCVVHDGAIVTSAKLWDAYQQWADDNGIKWTLKRKGFGQRLETMGFRSDRMQVNGKRQRVWIGVGLIDEDHRDTWDTWDTTSDNFFKTPLREEKLSDHASNASHASQPDDQASSSPLPACGHHENPSSQPDPESRRLHAEADAQEIEDIRQIESLLPKCPPAAQRILRQALEADVGTLACLHTAEAVLSGNGKFALDQLRRRTVFHRGAFR